MELLLEKIEGSSLAPLEAEELQHVDGGFLPAVAIGVCWGIQACCALVAGGMYITAKKEGVIK